ncbi:MAG TPA: hypothetical protein VGG71_11100 [Chitinophagaceae bacterium]|jgi:hypothetical protein
MEKITSAQAEILKKLNVLRSDIQKSEDLKTIADKIEEVIGLAINAEPRLSLNDKGAYVISYRGIHRAIKLLRNNLTGIADGSHNLNTSHIQCNQSIGNIMSWCTKASISEINLILNK